MIAESLFGQKNYEAAGAAYQQTLEHPPANKEFQALACLHAGQAWRNSNNGTRPRRCWRRESRTIRSRSTGPSCYMSRAGPSKT